MLTGRTQARGRALMILIVTVTVLAATAATSSARVPLRGVQLHSLWWGHSNAQMNRDLDTAAHLGSNTVRVDVSWGSLETVGKGKMTKWYVRKLDRFVAGARRRGMTVIATLWGTPCWASTAPPSVKRGCSGDWFGRGVPTYPPRKDSDYANMARWMTARYGTALAALEVWNEPNLASGRFWRARNRPVEYAELVRAAYPAAKAGNPAVPVLAGALADSDLGFLRRAYAAGMRGSYDGLSVHAYADPVWRKLSTLRQLQGRNGDWAAIWITEFGWPTGQSGWHVTEAKQATSLRKAFAAADRIPWIQNEIVYGLRDEGTDPGAEAHNFGLLRRDWSPKRAFSAVRDALLGSRP